MRPIIADFNETGGDGRFDSVVRSFFGDIRPRFTNLGRPEARLVSSPFGRCQLSVLEACRHDVSGDRVVRRSYDSDSIKVVMQLRGKTCFSQTGRAINLSDGDMLVYDPTRPYSFINETSVHLVLFQLPRDFLTCRTDMPDDLLQVYDAGMSGLPRVLASMLSSAGTGIECLDDDSRKHIGDTLTSLVCAVTKVGTEAEAEDNIPASILR